MKNFIKDLIQLSNMVDVSLKEITDFALESAINNTQSEIGYIAFIDDEETMVIANSWSKITMKDCTIPGIKPEFCVKSGGLWTEAITNKKPCVVNDYRSFHPLKKGLPEGHMPLNRVVTIPFYDHEKLVVLLSVANKKEFYSDLDVDLLTLLIDAMWKHTQRSKTKEKLVKKITNVENFYRKLIDLLPLGIFWKDENSVYLGCNDYLARVSGFNSPSELIGKSDKEFSWAVNAEKYRKDDIEVMSTGISKNMEETIDLTDQTIWAHTVKVPLRYDDNEIRGILGVYQDITHLKELQQSLESSNEELLRFAYVSSHDLKAPLRSVYNLATWIEEDAKEGKDVSKFIGMLQPKIQRMNALIDGLLEYSKIGQVHVEVEPINIQEIVRELERDLGVYIQVKSELPIIKVNRTRIYQVFSNLIQNSIKHYDKPDGLQVVIENWPEAICGNHKLNYWTFCVSDNGPGIDLKYHKKIFEIFQTLKPKDTAENTGIGLSIVKRIIEEFDGEIWVESELGKGSKFYFTIHK